MIIDELNELNDNGKLVLFIRLGIVPPKYAFYRMIYLEFLQYTLSGMKKMDTYTLLSDRYEVSCQTVINACNTMTRNI